MTGGSLPGADRGGTVRGSSARLMRVRRRAVLLMLAAALLGGCSVQESTRGGGLVPPTGPAPTTAPATPAVETVALDSAIGGLSVTAAQRAAAALAVQDTASGQAVAPATTASSPDAPGTATGHTVAASGETGTPVSSTDAAAGTRGDSAAAPASPQTQPDPASDARELLATADPPDGFDEGLLRVDGLAGTHVWPVVVADTPRARQQGLMGVSDFAALGGYAAMVFVFENDTSGAFWMRDTPLPLRITFVAANGAVVSSADMAPCLPPTPSGDCERYHPDGPYRIAIEHPLGPAFDIGLAAAYSAELIGAA